MTHSLLASANSSGDTCSTMEPLRPAGNAFLNLFTALRTNAMILNKRVIELKSSHLISSLMVGLSSAATKLWVVWSRVLISETRSSGMPPGSCSFWSVVPVHTQWGLDHHNWLTDNCNSVRPLKGRSARLLPPEKWLQNSGGTSFRISAILFFFYKWLPFLVSPANPKHCYLGVHETSQIDIQQSWFKISGHRHDQAWENQCRK